MGAKVSDKSITFATFEAYHCITNPHHEGTE